MKVMQRLTVGTLLRLYITDKINNILVNGWCKTGSETHKIAIITWELTESSLMSARYREPEVSIKCNYFL